MTTVFQALQRKRTPLGERNFTEQIKAPIFLETVLVTESMYELNLEQKRVPPA